MASPHRQPPPEIGTLFSGLPFEGVVGEAAHGKGMQPLWQLRCTCGAPIIKKAHYIKACHRQGFKPKCDDYQLNHFPAKIGDKFNMLTIRKLQMEEYMNGKSGATSKVLYAYCDCDCGNKNIRGAARHLLEQSMRWQSCGCKRSANNKARATHGMAGTKEYEIWCNAKQRAKRDNVPFDIEVDDIQIPEICPVLGIKLEVNVGGDTWEDASPSLDKFYPPKGYVKGNVQIISWKANRLKSNGTPEDWIKVANWCQQEDVRRKLEGD